MRLAIENCAVATVAGEVFADGHVVVDGEWIAAVGPGPARDPGIDRRIDAGGCLATPGLVNCHHHLYQHATRGLAQQATLFEWLTELYPVWARIDARIERAAARAGLGALLLSGCTTASDHHYVFPHGAGDLLAVEIEAARELGIRFNPCRGAMDLGVSAGGLPPDSVVEDRDAILAAYDAALSEFHDPAPNSMCRIALAPCSPFSVTRELMAESAEFARAHGLRLHTHMAETVEEEAFCLERFGMRPVEYLDELGWLGDDVWLAHCVHLDEREVARFGETGTGVAHCPSSNARLGAGIAPVVPLIRAGAPVGLGVDGAASNEAGELGGELRQALLVARIRGGPAALTAAEALELGTLHGARCLGRQDELGTLEPGKLADVVLWRLDGVDHAGIADPVAALVFGGRPLASLVMIGGRIVVEDGELRTADAEALARELAEVAR
jgi:cytosine/adenosine deaminase-related metal-dependent hydrolase